MPGTAVDASDASVKIQMHIDNLFWDSIQGNLEYSMKYYSSPGTYMKQIVLKSGNPYAVLKDGSHLLLGSLHLQGLPGKSLLNSINF
jgi:hypothetical protein